MINVTETFLPPLEEYQSYLQRVWNNRWLTNRGSLVLELEEKLKSFLKVPHLTLTANGTLPLHIAIKALGLKGEIITTPFSYVATTASIVWEDCKPVFVDIHPKYLTIDEEKIEAAITAKTSAILATHVFGNPCEVEKIELIANKYGLKVIYDAAHSFGVKYKGQSIFNYGDISTCSFHATKLFHTGEGGCWVTKDKKLQNELFFHHKFGHDGPEKFHGLGTNAKMSEIQAALGLAVFNHINVIYENRKKNVDFYNNLITESHFQKIKIRPETEWNYHYYPIIFDSEKKLLEVLKKLNDNKIIPRRYFYPSLNNLPYVDYQENPISEDISKRILCLPLSPYLRIEDIELITKLLK